MSRRYIWCRVGPKVYLHLSLFRYDLFWRGSGRSRRVFCCRIDAPLGFGEACNPGVFLCDVVIFWDPGRTGRYWLLFFKISPQPFWRVWSISAARVSGKLLCTIRSSNLFKHRNSRLVNFVYRFCSTFLIELSSYSKSRLTDDTYLRKTKSLLDHFKRSLARDRLFVIVIFVHPLQRRLGTAKTWRPHSCLNKKWWITPSISTGLSKN